MAKKLDMSKPVYELVQQYPELVDILKDLGFTEITKPAMLNSVGRITTIPKGAKMRGISMLDVVPTLMKHGFQLTGKMPSFAVMSGKASKEEESNSSEVADMKEEEGKLDAKESTKEVMPQDSTQNREVVEAIKGYLRRLGEGEDLESVRKDFVENFSEVDASEIMKAEQELIKEGTPITEVQKLCDVHSALFHGATREEKIANAEKAVETSLQKEEQKKGQVAQAYANKHELAKKLRETNGHPLYTWTQENEKLGEWIKAIQNGLESGEDVSELLKNYRQLTTHYAEKGDLVYPLLKVRYEISGPSDVMWTVDDEIRDELAALNRENVHDEDWKERLKAVLGRADEMIYKEGNILFPICAVNFTEEEWFEIYKDGKDYAPVFDVENNWPEAESYLKEKEERTNALIDKDEIVLAGGHLTISQLEAMLNTLPIEITFVDHENINRYFNEGPKVFKRPQMALDREVFSCHPPKIEPMVRAILDDFREGRRDSVPVWMNKNDKPFLVTYMAVRDKKGKYVGTIEVVQDMQFAKEYFTE